MKPHRIDLIEEFVRAHALHQPRNHVAQIGNLKRLFRPYIRSRERLHCPAVALIPPWETITEQTG